LDKQTNWGDLQAWQPGDRPREVQWPEDEVEDGQFQGVTINMREVINANISDGVKAAIARKAREKAEELERTNKKIDE
jgi:hypothetical protein